MRYPLGLGVRKQRNKQTKQTRQAGQQKIQLEVYRNKTIKEQENLMEADGDKQMTGNWCHLSSDMTNTHIKFKRTLPGIWANSFPTVLGAGFD